MDSGPNSPKSPDILPPVVENTPDVETNGFSAKPENYPAAPESASRPQPTVPAMPAMPLAPDPSGQPQTSPSQPNPASAASDDQTTKPSNPEELKKHYAEKVKRVMIDNAADPYTESRLIEEIKRQYLRDIYHREIQLPQE